MAVSSNQALNLAPSVSRDAGLRQLLFLTLFIVAMMGLWLAACSYSVIPTLEETAKAKWTNAQNQYQFRLDVIANLATAAQVYARQEKDTLTAVAEARAKATSAAIDESQLTDPAKMRQFEQAQEQVSAALSRLLVIGRNYPELMSNQNFLALQTQLAGAEKSITLARHGYIEFSRRFNNALKAFPTLLWARTFFADKQLLAEFSLKLVDD